MSSDYRQQYQAEVEQAQRQNEVRLKALLTEDSAYSQATASGTVDGNDLPIAMDLPDIARAFEILSDQSKPDGLRLAALGALRIAASENQEIFDAVVNFVGDSTQSIEFRTASLNLLKQLCFSSPLFATSAGKIADILRGMATDKQVSQELRESAIGILARQNDEYAQSILADGLKSPEKAVVTPLKALRWLSADSHYRDTSTLRKYASSEFDSETREMAVRLIAQDPQSKPLLAEILRDKKESPLVRRACAVAIRVLDPDDYSSLAQEIILDLADDGDVRACLLNGLTLESYTKKSADIGFKDAVQKLLSEPNEELRKSSEMYLRNNEE